MRRFQKMKRVQYHNSVLFKEAWMYSCVIHLLAPRFHPWVYKGGPKYSCWSVYRLQVANQGIYYPTSFTANIGLVVLGGHFKNIVSSSSVFHYASVLFFLLRTFFHVLFSGIWVNCWLDNKSSMSKCSINGFNIKNHLLV